MEETRRPEEEERSDETTYDPTWKFGDEMIAKEDRSTRIMTVQLNSFPTSKSSKDIVKRNMMRDLIRDSEADIVMTQEDNRYWPTVHTTYRPEEVAAT